MYSVRCAVARVDAENRRYRRPGSRFGISDEASHSCAQYIAGVLHDAVSSADRRPTIRLHER